MSAGAGDAPLRVALLGGSGRMGAALVAALDEDQALTLVGASCSQNSQWAGKDIADAVGGRRRGVTLTPLPAAAIANAQVAIDFALPEAASSNVSACVTAGIPLVIGATGHGAGVLEEIEAASRRIPLVMAPNMSLGVNLLLELVELAARSLDAGYDVEVFEAHHRNKKDAPSGTALALGRAAAAGRGVELEDAAEYARHGATGVRRSGAIGFSVFRGGDVVGDHTVTFAGRGERIELTHRATDRLAFARGALRAARWIAGRKPGRYAMRDVLGLRRD